jgi:hypothetical protein
MDRTERPSKRVAVNPGLAWEDVERQRDSRIGASHACATCFHAYSYPVTPLAPPSWVCHFGPGDSQFMQNAQGLALQTVPRVVAANFFCHQWKMRD